MGARDELSRFLDLIRNNQFASCESCGPLYKRLKDIDGCFTAIGPNPINAKNVLPPLLLIRSHGAYRWPARRRSPFAGVAVVANARPDNQRH